LNELLAVLNNVKTKDVKASERKSWNIPINTVLVPFLTVTNLEGKTNIPREDLGYPVKLSRDSDDNIRFSTKTGKPQLKLAKSISNHVKGMRDNLIAMMSTSVIDYYAQNKVAYDNERKTCLSESKPQIDKDTSDLETIELAKLEQTESEHVLA
jgi:hypothetical protein